MSKSCAARDTHKFSFKSFVALYASQFSRLLKLLRRALIWVRLCNSTETIVKERNKIKTAENKSALEALSSQCKVVVRSYSPTAAPTVDLDQAHTQRWKRRREGEEERCNGAIVVTVVRGIDAVMREMREGEQRRRRGDFAIRWPYVEGAPTTTEGGVLDRRFGKVMAVASSSQASGGVAHHWPHDLSLTHEIPTPAFDMRISNAHLDCWIFRG
ncbi:hypothetical protein E2542_SST07470 [Spatholobus suberectus]|nr:hypothetical protein E2542_SST07470 [Spatholobus suberectus]